MRITKPITKKSIQVKDANELPAIMFDLITTALDKRKGPVLMDVPKDVLIQKCDCEALLNEFKQYQANHHPVEIKIKDEDVNKVISYLNKSKKPDHKGQNSLYFRFRVLYGLQAKSTYLCETP